jgi:acyl carrier protein
MQTLERLIKVFNVVFEDSIDTSALTPEATLREDVGINSIGLLYMAMAVEEEFGIKFTNDDFASICTVADVIACIESKCKK